MTDFGASLESIELVNYGLYQSGFGFGDINGAPLQPGWTDRGAYA